MRVALPADVRVRRGKSSHFVVHYVVLLALLRTRHVYGVGQVSVGGSPVALFIIFAVCGAWEHQPPRGTQVPMKQKRKGDNNLSCDRAVAGTATGGARVGVPGSSPVPRPPIRPQRTGAPICRPHDATFLDPAERRHGRRHVESQPPLSYWKSGTELRSSITKSNF